jgi:hypothetical protein
LKSVDDKLKVQPKHFWKYVASFRKRNSNYIQLDVDGNRRIQPADVADEFCKHFQSVYNHLCSVVFPTNLSSSELLTLAPVSYSDNIKAINRLKPSKSVGLDGIPGFVINGCCDIFFFCSQTHFLSELISAIFSPTLETSCNHFYSQKRQKHLC